MISLIDVAYFSTTYHLYLFQTDKVIMAEKNLDYVDLHEDHENWITEIHFYRREVKFFRELLGEMAVKETDPEVKAQIEQFQNKFIMHLEKFDECEHVINRLEDDIEDFTELYEEEAPEIKLSDKEGMREKMATFRKLYKEMKDEFYLFYANQKKK